MKKLNEKPASSIVRRSVALPKAVVEEAASVAPPELGKNFNRLVGTALKLYSEVLRERRIDAEMLEMGKDPHILKECRKINAEFAQTDADGLRS